MQRCKFNFPLAPAGTLPVDKLDLLAGAGAEYLEILFQYGEIRLTTGILAVSPSCMVLRFRVARTSAKTVWLASNMSSRKSSKRVPAWVRTSTRVLRIINIRF
jgi:hypothetical protein